MHKRAWLHATIARLCIIFRDSPYRFVSKSFKIYLKYKIKLEKIWGHSLNLPRFPCQSFPPYGILQQHDDVILERGIVKVVDLMTHYLPHHPVIKEDKSTTKLRMLLPRPVVLHSMTPCMPNLMDILLRIVYTGVLAADIEKEFLMISITPHDRDVLCFLWVDDINKRLSKIVTLRFTHVVFGVSYCSFLLNATIKHRVEKYSPPRVCEDLA